jgi:hypothetical protein
MKPYFEQKDRQKVTKVGWLRYKQVHNENCDCLLRWGIGGGLMVGLRYGTVTWFITVIIGAQNNNTRLLLASAFTKNPLVSSRVIRLSTFTL